MLIDVTPDGYVLIHRCDYPHRDRSHMGDGDILARIPPDAYKDIADAKEIIEWLNRMEVRDGE